jgi:hypothetical protein
MGDTSEAKAGYTSEAYYWVHVSQSLVFCVMFSGPLFVF